MEGELNQNKHCSLNCGMLLKRLYMIQKLKRPIANLTQQISIFFLEANLI